MAIADKSNNPSKKAGSGRRGGRADALQGKRGATASTEEIGQKLVEAKGQARKKKVLSQIMGAGGSGGNERRKQLFGMLRAVLVRTPADSRGKVPETPFTQAGVERLMKTLKSRSEDNTAPGARVAGGLLKFLSADAGENAVHGASVTKLQKLAEREQQLRGNMGRTRN